MNIDKLPFSASILDIFRKDGMKKLNPPQADAIKKGVLKRKNMVVASPTASGKTFIAELAFLKNFLDGRGKTVYIVPLRALATEKFYEFSRKYKKLGMKIAVSVGDFDSADDWLGRYDLIIVTSEKMDSILRHSAKWIRDISLVVADEIHLINDVSRGPTLEVVLTRLRQKTNSQIIALSATIKNRGELAKWLEAKLVESDYRPVKLKKGVFYPNKIDFLDEIIDLKSGGKENEILLIEDTIKKNKQALIFVSSRRSAESCAEKVGKNIKNSLDAGTKQLLDKLSKDILHALSSPTSQCKRLSACIRNGSAFHHAGLVAKQRKLIEDAFRSGLIKIITATPTLAFGLNLPAWRVLIRDHKRFSGWGSDYIPVLEIEQMAGRSGRPKYDKEGQAILIAKTKDECEELKERYIKGEPEPIFSKMSVEPVLRLHILALIADETCSSVEKLKKFMEKTFFGFQYGSVKELDAKIMRIVNQLKEIKFIKTEGKNFISNEFVPAFELGSDKKIEATRIGKRVSQLYIDPLTAKGIIDRIKAINEKTDEFGIADMISDCSELYPALRLKSGEKIEIEDIIEKRRKTLVRNVPEIWEPEFDEFLESFKLSLLLNDWMEEKSEDYMLKKYNIPPGILYQKLKNAEWLLYSASELAKLMQLKNKRKVLSLINKTRARIKYGVKEKLLPLTQLRGIGRVRARLLFKAGIKSPSDIINTGKEKLEKILGKKTAEKILAEIK
ncbi:MAG: ATP-dependent DNA helicase [Candidatus Aenigmatarchaeota archaeon]|nr:MAG: ATP-dependent DNA helicase [Candidatus Aenigmarchaeota archaeon]